LEGLGLWSAAAVLTIGDGVGLKVFSRLLFAAVGWRKRRALIVCTPHPQSRQDEPMTDSPDRRLAGRVAIVTGAGTGIGQGIAVAMVKRGANVAIVGRTRETLEKTARMIEEAGGEALICQGSIADPAVAPRVAAETLAAFGRLDVLVNNGHTFSPPLPLDQTPESDMRQHIESGFFGTFYFMRAAFPHMSERGGSIINFGSMAGVQGWANFAPYAATKEAIRGLSRSASRDWGQYRIRVNVIVPSSHSKIADEYFSAPGSLEAVEATIPLGYLGDPELDIGGVAVFLASDDARYVTGQTLHADGGM
jgi:NAD(P)-dependent dehydrogenase (short-subunit alcohol dehydrogenase family)